MGFDKKISGWGKKYLLQCHTDLLLIPNFVTWLVSKDDRNLASKCFYFTYSVIKKFAVQKVNGISNGSWLIALCRSINRAAYQFKWWYRFKLATAPMWASLYYCSVFLSAFLSCSATLLTRDSYLLPFALTIGAPSWRRELNSHCMWPFFLQ